MRLISACVNVRHGNSRTVGALRVVCAANVQAIDLAIECWLKELVLFQIAVETRLLSARRAVRDFEIL